MKKNLPSLTTTLKLPHLLISDFQMLYIDKNTYGVL